MELHPTGGLSRLIGGRWPTRGCRGSRRNTIRIIFRIWVNSSGAYWRNYGKFRKLSSTRLDSAQPEVYTILDLGFGGYLGCFCRENCSHVHEHLFTVHRARYRVHGSVHAEPCAGPWASRGFFFHARPDPVVPRTVPCARHRVHGTVHGVQ